MRTMSDAKTVGNTMATIGNAATTGGAAVPGIGGQIIRGLGIAVSLVGELIAAGQDPVVHITRLRDLDRERRAIDDTIDHSIK